MEHDYGGSHNFELESQLKLYLDTVVKFGRTHMLTKFQSQQMRFEEVVKFEL